MPNRIVINPVDGGIETKFRNVFSPPVAKMRFGALHLVNNKQTLLAVCFWLIASIWEMLTSVHWSLTEFKDFCVVLLRPISFTC